MEVEVGAVGLAASAPRALGVVGVVGVSGVGSALVVVGGYPPEARVPVPALVAGAGVEGETASEALQRGLGAAAGAGAAGVMQGALAGELSAAVRMGRGAVHGWRAPSATEKQPVATARPGV